VGTGEIDREAQPAGADQWDHVAYQLQKWVDKNGGGAKNLNGAGCERKWNKLSNFQNRAK
jgi:hypothetical protein